MTLTDPEIRGNTDLNTPYKVSDRLGLYLLVTLSDKRLRRFGYGFEGKQKLSALGAYRAESLKAARERLDPARTLLAAQVDPNDNRKAQKAIIAINAENTIKVLARERITRFSHEGAPSHASRIIRRFERNIFPWLG